MSLTHLQIDKIYKLHESTNILCMECKRILIMCEWDLEKAIKYAEEMSTRHNQTLSLLFQDFTQEEIDKLFEFYSKLYAGIERLEDYAREIEK